MEDENFKCISMIILRIVMTNRGASVTDALQKNKKNLFCGSTV